ncbi:MAG: hypothetical protein AB9882_04645 [Ignavibacteriaceae bacterium]
MNIKQFSNFQSVALIAIAIIFATIFSLIPEGTTVLGYSIKKIDFFSDIRKVEPVSQKIENEIKLTQSAVNLAMFDILKYSEISSNFLGKELEKITLENAPMQNIGLSGNLSNLSYFVQAMKNAGSKKVRIAHFGDSAIEGDLVTATIRNNLQKEYKGAGVGFLSITSQDISFRMTTQHSFSSDWKSGSIMQGNPNKWKLGMNGSVSSPQSNSWVMYETTPFYKKTFSSVRVLYTDAKASSIKYTVNKGTEQTMTLVPGSGVKEINLNLSGDSKSIKFSFPTADQGKFFGVSLESGNGVYVDNFPLRGNSGVSIKDIPKDVLEGFNKILDYQLLILNFGLNMTTSGTSDFSWYEREMVKVVELLKSAFPQTSIIIVGVGDRSTKSGTQFITDPGIPKLIKAQKNVANTTGVVFWDLFEAMGGQNSMPKWVNSNPPLAMKDYTHMTLQGAEKIAKLFTDALLLQVKK